VSAQFTPGPWHITQTVHIGRKNIFGMGDRPYHVGTLISGSKSKLDLFDANAALIGAAPDHALVAWAMCVQDATWEELGDDGKGEFCFAGLRHVTSLDPFGCPALTENLRGILSRAFEDWRERTLAEAAA
jgi:hypothetical protein